MEETKDKYDFMCVVDDCFKECKTVSELSQRYTEMKSALLGLYKQNIAFLSVYNK